MGIFRWTRRPVAPPAPVRRPFAQRETALPPAPAGVLVTTGVFTPTQPKTGSRQITGRQAELRRILQALTEDRAHVVLYSERGRGKTSLSNMVVEILRRSGVIVARYTCDAGSDFDSIFQGLMRDLPSSLLANPSVDHGEGCEAALPARELRPGDVVALPQKLNCKSLVCLVDEFDRVRDLQTRVRLADTIKQLSDRDVRLQFLVVGVSDNLDEILGQHPSIQRSVLGVHLPLFTDRDMAQLISKASQDSGFIFPPEIVARVTVLARGMPYMAQLLGLRLTQAAAQRSSSEVCEEDLWSAASRLVEDANPRTVALYANLTDRGANAEMAQTLRRIASAPQDNWGRMEVTRLADARIAVGGRWVPADCWQRLLLSKVIIPSGGEESVVFADRMLMHHILLLAATSSSEAAAQDDAGAVVLRPIKFQA